jgi:sugar phosphate isomerase/epimerase
MITFVGSTYTYLWRHDLERAFEDIAAAGFTGVELLAAPPHVDLLDPAGSAERVLAAVRRTGLAVHSVVPSGVDVNLASVEPSMRDWSVDYFGQAGRLAAEVGARWLIAHPGRRHPFRPPPYEQCVEWAVAGLERVVAAVEREAVGVLLENTPTGVLDTAAECVQTVRLLGSADVGVCYDVANGHMVEEVATAIRHVGADASLVHLSDTTRERWAHDPIGTGDIPFREVASALSGIGYDGHAVLETLHGDDARAGFAADFANLRGAGWDTP